MDKKFGAPWQVAIGEGEARCLRTVFRHMALCTQVARASVHMACSVRPFFERLRRSLLRIPCHHLLERASPRTSLVMSAPRLFGIGTTALASERGASHLWCNAPHTTTSAVGTLRLRLRHHAHDHEHDLPVLREGWHSHVQGLGTRGVPRAGAWKRISGWIWRSA